jgi:hypothetical protein
MREPGRDLVAELDQSSLALDRGLVASYSTPSQHARGAAEGVLLAECWENCRRIIASDRAGIWRR